MSSRSLRDMSMLRLINKLCDELGVDLLGAGLLGVGGDVLSLLLGLGALEVLGIWVELDHHTQVLEWVLLDAVELLHGASWAGSGLDLGRVDHAREISVGHDCTWWLVSGLVLGLGEDDERSTTLDVTPVTHLTLSGADGVGVLGLDDVIVCAELLKDLLGLEGLVAVEGVDNEWDLRDLFDLVAAGHDEGREGGSSECGADGVAALVHADLAVPLPPGLGRVEHATSTTHVTESSLSCAVGTTTLDTRDTGHGAASSPRLGGLLVASPLGDGVCLAGVLGHVGVHEVHNIRTDWCKEHRRHCHLGWLVSAITLDGYAWAGGPM